MPSNPKNTRRCIVCKQHCDKSNMIRFVKDGEGKVIVDKAQCADGRGVWVHNSADCLLKLAKKRMLNSAFKQNVGDEIYGELDEYN